MTSSTTGSNTHRPARWIRTAALTGAATLVLAGCNLFGNGDDGDTEGDGGNGEDRSGGHITVQHTNFAHIDPQSITFGMWLVQKGLLEGLV
ncbi:MAG TPA: hypothetical protein VK095_02615, partial [Beutenbergiaceae bacterium]|nr:hypothetical protein [Beutenbergiaceae bacterium]